MPVAIPPGAWKIAVNQAATIVHARGTTMLRSVLGVHVSGWLDDPAVAEIMVNADFDEMSR